uniref:C-type lectin domain-containing protein n=1 Tax=Amphiprion percula TaxID=161767 RepID=A0A3P8RUF9_AMPPE
MLSSEVLRSSQLCQSLLYFSLQIVKSHSFHLRGLPPLLSQLSSFCLVLECLDIKWKTEHLQICRNVVYMSVYVPMEEFKESVDRLTAIPTCPAGWKMFSCTCYLLSQASDSWTNGREDCKRQGADLVVINSAEEQTFLSMFAKKQTWIGLNDIQTEGTWMWVDGTPLTLSYWDTDEPNNGGEEDCAQIRTAHNTLWDDVPCTSSLQWICEKLP